MRQSRYGGNSMTELYPFRLSSVTKSPIWGGTRLLRDWGKESAAATVGESWELTVRKNEKSVILDGPLAGKTLEEVIAETGSALIAPDWCEPTFPLLIKLIDAADRLSVQVHPDDAYAAQAEHDRGKTEMWYIVDADPDAEIVCGLREGIGRAEFAAAVRAGKIDSVLHRQKVKPGETYFIPAGLLHAIGRGILIAEIQQNCDLTYRVYDYDRKGADGKPRELHVEKALDVVRPFTEEEINAIRFSQRSDALADGEVLADCDFFRVERLKLTGQTVTLPDYAGMRHLLCVGGAATLSCGGTDYAVAKGGNRESWFLPPHLPLTVTGTATLIFSAV